MVYLIDTHALVWFLQKDAQLGPAAAAALQDPASEIVIPAIVLAEIAFLNSRSRITLDLPTVLSFIGGASNGHTYPLDEQVAQLLPGTLKIHDAIIVATAILFRDVLRKPAAVVTKDAAITASGLIPVVW
jgi:PIN domain nuclease of toxin-antitoxin system